ncbi:MAG: protein kinase domain-containing protein [Spirochaetia bacterium]
MQHVQLNTGTIIEDNYEIQEKIGQGGMGTTYLAKKDDEELVMKLVSLKQVDDWKGIELFEREIKTLKNIDHPNIPDYIDSFETKVDDTSYYVLVQEYAAGKSIQDLVRQGRRFSEDEVSRVLETMLEILDYIHNLNPPIIHRDVNPKNIILTDSGKVYLVDFGAVGSVVQDTIMAGNTFVGTMGYMPQEQYYGKLTPATDLYALGLTCVYMLTGKHPYELETDGLKVEFTGLADISERLCAVVSKMIEPNANDRFQSAKTALDVLLGKVKLQDFETEVTAMCSIIYPVLEDDGAIRLELPKQKGQKIVAAFLIFFSLIWDSFLVTFFGVGAGDFFTLIFMLPFIAVGIGLPLYALYLLFGKEEIRLGKDNLSITRMIFQKTFQKKQIPYKEIRSVAVQETNTKNRNTVYVLKIYTRNDDIAIGSTQASREGLLEEMKNVLETAVRLKTEE